MKYSQRPVLQRALVMQPCAVPQSMSWEQLPPLLGVVITEEELDTRLELLPAELLDAELFPPTLVEDPAGPEVDARAEEDVPARLVEPPARLVETPATLVEPAPAEEEPTTPPDVLDPVGNVSWQLLLMHARPPTQSLSCSQRAAGRQAHNRPVPRASRTHMWVSRIRKRLAGPKQRSQTGFRPPPRRHVRPAFHQWPPRSAQRAG